MFSTASVNHTDPSGSRRMPVGTLHWHGKSTLSSSVPSGATRSAPMADAFCSAKRITVLPEPSCSTSIWTGRRVGGGAAPGSGGKGGGHWALLRQRLSG